MRKAKLLSLDKDQIDALDKGKLVYTAPNGESYQMVSHRELGRTIDRGHKGACMLLALQTFMCDSLKDNGGFDDEIIVGIDHLFNHIRGHFPNYK